MELSLQLCILAFATGLFYVVGQRLPTVTAARWWFYGSASGCVALILDLAVAAETGNVQSIVLTVALSCSCAQTYFVGRGLLCVDGSRRKLTCSSLLVASLLLVTASVHALVTTQSARAIGSTTISGGLVPSILCGMLALQLYFRRTKPERAAVAAFFLGLCTVGVLHGFAEFDLLPEAVTHVLLKLTPMYPVVWGIMAQCAAALVMTYLALSDAYAHNLKFHQSSERWRSLVESVACAICEFDPSGRLTYANPAAVAMMGANECTLAGTAIDKLLHVRQSGPSAQALSDLLLRPTIPISRATARVHLADQSAISAEWSTAPILRGQKMAGFALTLHDITESVQAERFTTLRRELLEMIARNVSFEETGQRLATAIEEQFKDVCCSILVCEGDNLRVVASPTIPDAFRSAMNELPASRFVGRGEQRPWEQTLREIAPRFGFAQTWTEPMVSSANEVVGVVVLNHHTGTSSAGQLEILAEVARLGALAIERHRSFERLMHQGNHDALTGLPNRFLFTDRLKQTLARAVRTRGQFAVLCIDLDRFKYVNDTLGHDLGDLFLQQISVRFAARVRASDTLARTGGDEFTAIASDLRYSQDAVKLADSLIAALKEPFEIEGHSIYGAASIGVAVYPQDGTDAETLLRNADRAMYRAKAQGSNTIQYYSSAEAVDVSERLDIELHLHKAIEQGNFSINYQPQFTCDRRLCGFEALLRFRHPKLGPVPPSRFIPLAEESGLILPIGQWVLHEVCRQIAQWQKDGMHPLRVAINVSPLQFVRPDFAETVARALRTSGIKPALLELELTEGVLMKTGAASAAQINAIAKMGMRLAVDDFGTGYSSLSYLHQLPIHVLKIDRSFIEKMLEPGGTRSIVEAIISLAHRLGLQTVAEGVEKVDQLALLQSSGCDLIQGFLFSKPLSAVDASRLMWQHRMMGSTSDAGPSWPSVIGTGPRMPV